MEKIKVAGIEYAVKYNKIESTGDGIQFGWCRFDKAELEINNEINEQKQKQTLIHELTHAIFHEAGLDELALDEEVINPLSLVLYQVLKDNDFGFLSEEDKANG